MTIIDELLILQDDESKRTLDDCVLELETKTRQVISSTLGRLAGKGLIKAKSQSKEKIYSITEDGQELITKTLKHIELMDEKAWNEHWFFVIFNIPEKHRKYRDLLRHKLISAGFGRMQNSLWINARDLSFELEDIIKDKKLNSFVTVLQPKLNKDDISVLVKNLEFDWNSLKAQYEDFSKKAQEFLDSKNQKPLFARFLVYHYAKACASDPKIPKKYSPIFESQDKARILYEEIREYCYE